MKSEESVGWKLISCLKEETQMDLYKNNSLFRAKVDGRIQGLAWVLGISSIEIKEIIEAVKEKKWGVFCK